MADPPPKKAHAPRRRWLRWGLVLAALAFLTLAAADALGAFDEAPYTAVPHGNHNHYVPNRCTDVRVDDFPMRPPRKGEHITCDGTIVSG